MSELQKAMAEVNDLNRTHGVTQRGGKKYTEVFVRVEAFRKAFGTDHGINTEILMDDGKRVVIKAAITNSAGMIVTRLPETLGLSETLGPSETWGLSEILSLSDVLGACGGSVSTATPSITSSSLWLFFAIFQSPSLLPLVFGRWLVIASFWR